MGSASDEKVELVEYMSKLQYFSHKAGLSIQAENAALANFYLHEVEEVIELVREVKEYDGHPIGQLASTMLEPAFETLEQSVDAKQFKQAQTDYGEMLKACNQCHISYRARLYKNRGALRQPIHAILRALDAESRHS